MKIAAHLIRGGSAPGGPQGHSRPCCVRMNQGTQRSWEWGSGCRTRRPFTHTPLPRAHTSREDLESSSQTGSNPVAPKTGNLGQVTHPPCLTVSTPASWAHSYYLSSCTVLRTGSGIKQSDRFESCGPQGRQLRASHSPTLPDSFHTCILGTRYSLSSRTVLRTASGCSALLLPQPLAHSQQITVTDGVNQTQANTGVLGGKIQCVTA